MGKYTSYCSEKKNSLGEIKFSQKNCIEFFVKINTQCARKISKGQINKISYIEY